MVGSLIQPLSDCMSIFALRQHCWPLSLPAFISSQRLKFSATAEGERGREKEREREREKEREREGERERERDRERENERAIK